ncbi:hypothetical protein MPC4_100008 [Methylocella tundrae]|uniref:Uncharacterized protein n=1 Tax=Methylocella tundrae TaxID=227605 RepID=A0A8B6M1F7_METTU|nr:hypothetical protein MPC1_1590003 [Methylocella tundrae]VTZ48565.1 hypothetical protein MPC4_100008 [Methylocella tundrae]
MIHEKAFFIHAPSKTDAIDLGFSVNRGATLSLPRGRTKAKSSSLQFAVLKNELYI